MYLAQSKFTSFSHPVGLHQPKMGLETAATHPLSNMSKSDFRRVRAEQAAKVAVADRELAEAYLEVTRIAERAAVAFADMWEMGENINRWEANYPGALRTLHYLRNKMKRTSSRRHHLDGCSNKFSERFKEASPRAAQNRRWLAGRPPAHDRRWLAAHGMPPNGDGRP